MSRKPISKSLRFRVLSRDAFTCRYCGATPPDVVLHLDHVVPVAKGGENTIENLVTACLPCNIGKGVLDAAPGQGRAPVTDKSARKHRPQIEFFWLTDYSERRRPVMVEARCLEFPAHFEADARWKWEEYFRYCDAPYPRHFATHGASGQGFSPYEAAMYAAEILHARWQRSCDYIAFVDDLILMRAAGHLPDYCAPFILRALHYEALNERCDELSSDYEDIADSVAKQASAAFRSFIDREHIPWQPR